MQDFFEQAERPVLAGWLPAEIVLELEPARLPPEDASPEAERRAVAGAVPKRQAEFLCGRIAARRALGRLGRPAEVLLPGPGRAPRWPEGVVGSISHGAGWCLAAVASARRFAGLGVDLEPDAPLDEELIRRVATPAERAVLPERIESRGRAAKRLFCAKESVYKAQHPGFGCFLGFQDVEIRFDGKSGSFRAALAAAARPEGLEAGGRARLDAALAAGTGAWRRSGPILLFGFHLAARD